MKTQSFIFNSAVSVSFNEAGYLNATVIATHFGKLVGNYLRNERTQEYIQALAETLSVMRNRITEKSELVIKKQGGTGQGTWLHPKLAIDFARWLDAKFAVWCDMKIEEILGINQAQPDTRINAEQKQAIREAVQDRHHRTGEHWQEIYRKLHNLLRVNSYHEIQAKDFQTALDFLASIENAPAKPEPKSNPNMPAIKRAAERMCEYFEQTAPAVQHLNRPIYAAFVEHYKVLKIYTPELV